MPKIKKIKATVMFGHIVPHSASDEAHLWPQQHDHDHCCQPRRSALECSGSSASTVDGSIRDRNCVSCGLPSTKHSNSNVLYV